MTRSASSGHDLGARVLQALAPWREAPAWHVGFSGGLDSTVLLHLLAVLAKQHGLPPLRAIHVHHGLQVAADAWPPHCRRVCDALGIPLQVVHVDVPVQASLESAARQARYGAFAEGVGEGGVLLTGQHRDDQAETVLFRLLRGAGVRGLAAIPEQRALGGGTLVRPLLAVSRAELVRYAHHHGLAWIEDPSNADDRHARNFLRNRVMPVLQNRWPQADASMARTAEHMSEAQSLLDELAQQDLSDAHPVTSFVWLGLPALALAPLARLSAVRQRNALRHWLAPLSRLPDADHWASWETLRDAGEAARPIWRLTDGAVHRADGHLWWIADAWPTPCQAVIPWPEPGGSLMLPGNGAVTLAGNAPSGVLEVRYRTGGEIMPSVTRGRRDLKRLLNECGVPAFVRGRLPLLYRDGQLLAVANIPGLDGCAHGNWRLQWAVPTSDQSLS